MVHIIGQGCCKDASCVSVCPVDCIRPRPGDPEFSTVDQLYIDPAACIDCGACIDACPVSAIGADPGTVPHFEEFERVNARHFIDRRRRDYALVPTSLPRQLEHQLRVAVIGAGPTGCYAAAVLSSIGNVEVSVFERLPIPYGLVRFGVAPDHQSTKAITNEFAKSLAAPGVFCYFNVEVGRHITIDEIRSTHHALIVATGANGGRSLGIPGEELSGVVSAHEFVGWYNGHPDHAHREFDLSGTNALIIGNGNVALDVARVLAVAPSRFAASDMPPYARTALERSSVRTVTIAARRSPEYAAFTLGEALALDRLEEVSIEAVSAANTAEAPLPNTDRAGLAATPLG